MKTLEQIKDLIGDIKSNSLDRYILASNICLIDELLVHDTLGCISSTCTECKCYNISRKILYVNKGFC